MFVSILEMLLRCYLYFLSLPASPTAADSVSIFTCAICFYTVMVVERGRHFFLFHSLLIYCLVVWELWTLVFSWFGLKWAISRIVMKLLIAWLEWEKKEACLGHDLSLFDVDNMA